MKYYTKQEISDLSGLSIGAIERRIKRRNIKPARYDNDKHGRPALFTEKQFEKIVTDGQVGRPKENK